MEQERSHLHTSAAAKIDRQRIGIRRLDPPSFNEGKRTKLAATAEPEPLKRITRSLNGGQAAELGDSHQRRNRATRTELDDHPSKSSRESRRDIGLLDG